MCQHLLGEEEIWFSYCMFIVMFPFTGNLCSIMLDFCLVKFIMDTDGRSEAVFSKALLKALMCMVGGLLDSVLQDNEKGVPVKSRLMITKAKSTFQVSLQYKCIKKTG